MRLYLVPVNILPYYATILIQYRLIRNKIVLLQYSISYSEVTTDETMKWFMSNIKLVRKRDTKAGISLSMLGLSIEGQKNSFQE